MEVVINDSYGGYALSPLAKCLAYDQGSIAVQAIPLLQMIPSAKKDTFAEDWKLQPLCFIPEGEKVFYARDGWVYLPKGQLILMDNTSSIPQQVRTCPILIAVVKRLGSLASGYGAKLTIQHIPDGLDSSDWQIREEGGLESIRFI